MDLYFSNTLTVRFWSQSMIIILDPAKLELISLFAQTKSWPTSNGSMVLSWRIHHPVSGSTVPIYLMWEPFHNGLVSLSLLSLDTSSWWLTYHLLKFQFQMLSLSCSQTGSLIKRSLVIYYWIRPNLLTAMSSLTLRWLGILSSW